MTTPDVTGQHRKPRRAAAEILDQMGVRRAPIAAHTSGAAMAAQLALGHPETVHTLSLLEPWLLSASSGEALLQQAGPAFQAYESGDRERARWPSS